jgi:glycosyltransferase involved in cell wall biosynthesis
MLTFLSSYLKEVRPDKVIVFVDRMIVLTWLTKFIFRGKYKIIAVIPNISSKYYQEKFLGILRKKVTLLVLRNVDKVIVRSRSTQKDMVLAGVDSSKIETIVNAVRVVSSTAVKKLDEKKLRLIFIGRLTKIKNVACIIKAIYILKKEGIKNVNLWIVGGGPMLNKLQNQVQAKGLENQVKLWGWRNNPLRFLSKSDVLVLSSIAEGCPLVILEAKMLGIPTITSDYSGVTELITNQRDGFIYPVNDSHFLAHCIKEFILSPELLARMKKNALKSSKKFNFMDFVNRHEKVILNV